MNLRNNMMAELRASLIRHILPLRIINPICSVNITMPNKSTARTDFSTCSSKCFREGHIIINGMSNLNYFHFLNFVFYIFTYFSSFRFSFSFSQNIFNCESAYYPKKYSWDSAYKYGLPKTRIILLFFGNDLTTVRR